MASVLDDIIAGVRVDLAERQSRTSLTELERRLAQVPPALDAAAAIRSTPGIAIIAEVKRASPSVGPLAPIRDPAALAGEYAAGGAAVVSVLTEQRSFQGSLADLAEVRQAIEIPLLRKDFVVTPYQVTESRAWGADAILLIVAALSQRELVGLREQAEALGMTAVVEVHDEDEARRATDSGASVIGVNARDLKTLTLDRSTFARLRPLIPEGAIAVAESGIRSTQDVREYAAQGAWAVLVGEALVSDGSPREAVAALTGGSPAYGDVVGRTSGEVRR